MKRRVGRPKLTPDAREFREEIARQLKAAQDSRGLTVSQAAAALAVSRQSFHQYLAARATPHPETLARAMDLGGIKPLYKGQEISRGAFVGALQRVEAPSPSQLSMLNVFDVPQECHNDNLVVVVKRSRDSMLQITMKMKKMEGLPPRRTRDGSRVA
jgi:hypothetical protein